MSKEVTIHDIKNQTSRNSMNNFAGSRKKMIKEGPKTGAILAPLAGVEIMCEDDE